MASSEMTNGPIGIKNGKPIFFKIEGCLKEKIRLEPIIHIRGKNGETKAINLDSWEVISRVLAMDKRAQKGHLVHTIGISPEIAITLFFSGKITVLMMSSAKTTEQQAEIGTFKIDGVDYQLLVQPSIEGCITYDRKGNAI